MNILLATYWYLPHVGGVDVYMNLLAKQLERLGHRVDILAHHPDMEKIYLMNTGQAVEKKFIKDPVYDKLTAYYEKRLPHVEPWVRWREIERYVYELAALYFGLQKYDLIHTQDIVSTRALARVKPQHSRHIATIHGLLANEHLVSGDIKSQDCAAFRYVSAEELYGATSAEQTIVPSNWLCKALQSQFHVPARHLKVIPYGIDVASLLSGSELPLSGIELRGSVKYLLCPARLVPVKGHQYLLQALRKLLDVRSDFVCWIAGSGELEESLKRETLSLRLNNHVVFLGPRKDIPALMRRAYAMVLPSIQDNSPFSVMESQILGLPVVASNTGGIPEMITHGETGLLFHNTNSTDLFRRLNQLLDHPELCAKLATNGRNFGLHQWSPQVLMQNTWAVYTKGAGGSN